MNMVKSFKLLVSFMSVFLLTTCMFFTSTIHAAQSELNFELGDFLLFNNASFRDEAVRDVDSNSGVFLTFSSPTNSLCTLKIFYANGDNNNRGAKVISNNGKIVREVSFPPTGGWSKFSSVSVSILSAKFANVIILTGGSSISSYAPDIKGFSVIGENISKIFSIPQPPKFPITEVEVAPPVDSTTTVIVVPPPPVPLPETEVEVVTPVDSTVRTVQVTPPPVQVTQ